MSIALVRAVLRYGPAKPADKLMLVAIAEHADDDGLAWPGIALLATECSVGPKAASATVQRLKRAGWVSVTTGGGLPGSDRVTNRYRINLAVLCDAPPSTGVGAPLSAGVGAPPSTGGKPPVEPPVEPTTPAADATRGTHHAAAAEAAPTPAERRTLTTPTSPAAERNPMTTARAAAADQPLDGMPTPQPPVKDPTAGDLVAAWCSGWTAGHGGAQPHPSVVRRVAGVCRNVAKDCDTTDDWRDAWRAAQAAGRRGRYDVVAHLAEPTQQGRDNYFLDLARDPGKLATGGLLGAMLANPPGGYTGPRALPGGGE